MLSAGCFAVAEGLTYNRTGGAYGGSIALLFLALIAIGGLGQIMIWVLKWAFPIRLNCPKCNYDLSLMDGQMQVGDECPGCDSILV